MTTKHPEGYKCPICHEYFHGRKCDHSEADVERHLNPPKPKRTVVKSGVQQHDEPIRMTVHPVPEAAMHVFVPLMDVINSADEIWGVHDVDDYIAMFEAAQAEITVRLQNARELKRRGL